MGGREHIKDMLADIASGVNREAVCDKLTGLMLVYETHSVHVVEGSEDCVGTFMKRLRKVDEELFKEARVVLVYNNINQVCMPEMKRICSIY